jgi:transient receptor potential cation channel subfamily M protein 3
MCPLSTANACSREKKKRKWHVAGNTKERERKRERERERESERERACDRERARERESERVYKIIPD